MHSSEMCTIRLFTVSRSIRWGWSAQPPNADPPTPGGRPLPPVCRTPSPPDADPMEADPSWIQIPLPLDADPPVNRMTHKCKNITLPQTSFAFSNKSFLRVDTITNLICGQLDVSCTRSVA